MNFLEYRHCFVNRIQWTKDVIKKSRSKISDPKLLDQATKQLTEHARNLSIVCRKIDLAFKKHKSQKDFPEKLTESLEMDCLIARFNHYEVLMDFLSRHNLV